MRSTVNKFLRTSKRLNAYARRYWKRVSHRWLPLREVNRKQERLAAMTPEQRRRYELRARGYTHNPANVTPVRTTTATAVTPAVYRGEPAPVSRLERREPSPFITSFTLPEDVPSRTLGQRPERPQAGADVAPTCQGRAGIHANARDTSAFSETGPPVIAPRDVPPTGSS